MIIIIIIVVITNIGLFICVTIHGYQVGKPKEWVSSHSRPSMIRVSVSGTGVVKQTKRYQLS